MITTDKTQLNINVLTQEQYEQAKANEELDADGLYMVPEDIAVLLTGAITYQEYSYPNYTFSSQQYRSITLSKPTKTGYTPILVKCVVTSHAAIHMFNYRFSEDNMIVEGINRTTTAVNNATIVCGIIWVKDELYG